MMKVEFILVIIYIMIHLYLLTDIILINIKMLICVYLEQVEQAKVIAQK